ncbi:hypothetical protein F8M41_000699 [Gigaspora margarita]|uniref:Uncharacterized protein n=1 Tax=Gigaspora margarita TaxID=4874 RepID=A0A8H4A8D9_GIGMA|nr:hypothetical protein F8M41_000699 [Gigaspora margarita]
MYITPIEAFAINIFKRTNVLPENTVFSEVDPCLLCGEGLYLPLEFLPFREFTLALCGHIYYQKTPQGLQNKPTTSTAEDTATKQVDSKNPTFVGEDANAIYMNELGLLGGEDILSKLLSKKVKTTGGKKVSSMLKKLIEELLADTPVIAIRENLKKANESATSIFLQLSDKIDNAETKNEGASQDLIFSYLDFEEAVFKRYKELKLEHGKDGSQALVKSEVREAIPEAKCSDKALRKRMKRSEKVYKLFNGMGKEKIAQIKSTPPGFILNLTKDEKDYVMAEILKKKV